MNLGLGTVQFGVDYGISNKGGQTPPDEVKEILSLAEKAGLSIIDTAAQYGNSEEVLGRCLSENHPFRIVTKTPAFKSPSLTGDDGAFLKETFYLSLQKLKQSAVYGLLIHNAKDLLSTHGNVLWRAMQELRDAALVEKIGVSVYSPEQLDAVLQSYRIDLVQLPVNVLDQRMIRYGHLRKFKEQGIEIHTRSVFLQGLLLMDPTALSKYFSPVRHSLTEYHQLLKARGIKPTEAALGFVCGIPEIDAVIVGVNDAHQLKEFCASIGDASLNSKIDFASFSIDDERIINPTFWN